MASENGWEPSWVGQDRLNWVDIPGCDVRIQTQKGLPTAILRAWIADHNAYIEPVRDRDTASYTPTNSVSTSNHLNGTAADVNWDSHPFHVKGTFTPEQMKTLREMLDFYEGTIFWAGDWRSPIDEMHVQLGYGTYGNPHTADFVARKIRADGYSTFRRGNTAPAVGPADILARATGLSLARAAAILPTVRDGLLASECTNANRIAMWLAQIGHESGGFQYTEEIASGSAYEGRLDLGNTMPGDGVRFKGRSWIQITGRNNYGLFSGWAARAGLVTSPTYFVDYPQKLSELRWAGVGAAWYWTAARPQINSLSDGGDLLGVTRAINGGTNGIADRNDRFKRARALGDELLRLLDIERPRETIEDLLMADTRYESWSIYADPSEGAKLTLADFVRAIDAREHERLVRDGALAGDLGDIHKVFKVAAGAGKYKDQYAINRAKTVIAEIQKTNPDALKAYLASKGVA